MNNKIKGYSLISLMVGTALSLMCIVAMLNVYKLSIKNAYGDNGVVKNSSQDSNLSYALFVIQGKLQGAGYGIASSASNVNLVLIDNANLTDNKLTGTIKTITTSSTIGNAIVYEKNPTLGVSSTYTCNAIFSDAQTNAIYFLKSNSSCNPAKDNWNTVTWLSSKIVEDNKINGKITFSLSKSTTCTPLGVIPSIVSGVTTVTGGNLLTINSTNSSTGTVTKNTLCLSNLS